MEEKNEDKINEKEELEKTDSIKEEEIKEENTKKEEDNITREINLDELYDGAINNTVIIDPVSKDEILELNKKSNKILIIIILVTIILLVLYYVNSNFDLNIFNKKKEDKTQSTTTTITTTKKLEENGTLICEFNAKSDSESQTVTYTANYVDSIINKSEFNYVLMSNLESISEESSKLQSEYESYFINNAAVVGNNVTFEKTEKGFNFNDKVSYDIVDFNAITIEDGKMNYFVKPSAGDTYLILKDAYEKKGFSCKLTSVGAEYNEKTSANNN